MQCMVTGSNLNVHEAFVLQSLKWQKLSIKEIVVLILFWRRWPVTRQRESNRYKLKEYVSE